MGFQSMVSTAPFSEPGYKFYNNQLLVSHDFTELVGLQ
jgi:hypothetical protein